MKSFLRYPLYLMIIYLSLSYVYDFIYFRLSYHDRIRLTGFMHLLCFVSPLIIGWALCMFFLIKWQFPSVTRARSSEVRFPVRLRHISHRRTTNYNNFYPLYVLKTMCRHIGLRVSGNKLQVAQRVYNYYS